MEAGVEAFEGVHVSNKEGSFELMESPLGFPGVSFSMDKQHSPIRSNPDVAPLAIGVLVDIGIGTRHIVAEELDIADGFDFDSGDFTGVGERLRFFDLLDEALMGTGSRLGLSQLNWRF